MSSYPRQSFLYRDHILLHHHHQLDALFVAHGDLAGHVADVFSWRAQGEKRSSAEGGSSALLSATDRLNEAARTFGCLTHDRFVLRLAEVLPKGLVLLLVVPFA